jgi:hypothetical protein
MAFCKAKRRREGVRGDGRSRHADERGDAIRGKNAGKKVRLRGRESERNDARGGGPREEVKTVSESDIIITWKTQVGCVPHLCLRSAAVRPQVTNVKVLRDGGEIRK